MQDSTALSSTEENPISEDGPKYFFDIYPGLLGVVALALLRLSRAGLVVISAGLYVFVATRFVRSAPVERVPGLYSALLNGADAMDANDITGVRGPKQSCFVDIEKVGGGCVQDGVRCFVDEGGR